MWGRTLCDPGTVLYDDTFATYLGREVCHRTCGLCSVVPLNKTTVFGNRLSCRVQAGERTDYKSALRSMDGNLILPGNQFDAQDLPGWFAMADNEC